MDLGLQVRRLAAQLGADQDSLTNWEEGRTAPAIRYVPGVLAFLGYDPRPVPEDLAGRLVHHRVGLGLSQEAFARLLGVDPGTLRRWESGRRQPQEEYLTRVNAALKSASLQ